MSYLVVSVNLVNNRMEGILQNVEVALVNKNPVINYLAANIKKADKVIWLYENSNLVYLNNVEKLLQSSYSVEFERIKIPLKDYNKLELIVNNIKEQYQNDRLILNLSGGSQVSGYIIYKTLCENAKDIFVIDPDKNCIVDLTNKKSEIIHTNLTVNEYIRLYGMKMRSGIHFDPKIGERSKLTYFIGNNINVIVPFLDKIREAVTRKNIEDKEWKLDRKGVKFSVQKKDNFYTVNYGKNSNSNQTKLENIAEEYLFRGEWLRELVFLRVNKSHFGDVRLNIKLDPDSVPKNKKIETIIDVAMRRRCKFYIFQCFSYPISKNSFIALNAIARTIEELNADSFILLSHRPPNSFIARAHSSGIKIVYGDKIVNFSI